MPLLSHETVAVAEMPECPLTDGSLAYSDRLRITINNAANAGVQTEKLSDTSIFYQELSLASLREYHQLTRFLACEVGVLVLRVPPQQTHFTSIFSSVVSQLDGRNLCESNELERARIAI